MSLKLQKENLTQTFVETFIKAIIDGEFKPGEKILSEAEIAEKFGVSRTLVREGISTLASIGMIHKRQGMVSRIAPRSSWDFLNRSLLKVVLSNSDSRHEVMSGLYEMRILIECHAAAEAAQRRTDEDVLSMKKIIDQLDDLVGDPEALLEADGKLHTAIHESMHDMIFSSVLRNFQELLKIAHSYMIVNNPDELIPIQHHKAIFSAIAHGDSKKARKVMEEHLRWTISNTIDQ